MTAPGRWADLGPRVVSAVVLVAIGAVAIWFGGLFFTLFVGLLVVAMVWELLRMLAPENSDQILIASTFCGMAILAFGLFLATPAPMIGLVGLVILGVALMFVTGRAKLTGAGYGTAILLGCAALILMRTHLGPVWVLWVVALVVASDVAGYFAGKSLGGPKFWPAISPKKTWSGTIAGWIGAGIVGAAFGLYFGNVVATVALSVVLAFAAQLGDIAESAIKRANGVKDSSALIPGHGGVLDRFDAMLGAAVVVLISALVLDWPAGLLG